ncbi:acyl-CoA dehydrogenase [Desulfothermus sp.]
MLLNPKKEKFENLDYKSKELMKETVDFFEHKGLAKIKEDDHERVWYQDFLDFQKDKGLFATLLTPSSYSDDPDKRWDTYRNCVLNEILGFYGLPYWYTWQVTILGLGPIWMGENEEVKKKTVKLLEDGGIFAFGLSEKAHGADLYSTEMMLTPLGDGKYVADGGKYYIGNGNAAALVSIFGKDSETDDFVFFVVDPKHENYECVKNVVNSQNYVAELALHSYPITDNDILSKGKKSWDDALNTINVGKLNLGWASIGICTHAFYEALNHASKRNLYGKFVTEFPHIKQLFLDAYTRLVAMKMFSSRAIDYMRSASLDDRRYLLYNPMVKMKVTTQGEEVINLLWDVIAAKGFEKDVYFEMATRDIRALPKLEGTVHVNMALVVKFMPNYFFNPKEFDPIPKRTDAKNDDFLFNQGPTGGLSKVLFHDYNLIYNKFDFPNLRIFKEQVELFKQMLMADPPTKEQAKDIDYLLQLGELFSLVAYGQLILEEAEFNNTDVMLLDQIFDFMVRDFSRFAVQLYHKRCSSPKQMEYCLKMVRKPQVDDNRFEKIYKDYILSLVDTYEMNP